MYRADDDLGGAPEVVRVVRRRKGKYHRAAEAIRKGCKLRRYKACGVYRDRGRKACALGAAMFAVAPRRRCSWDSVAQVFPELMDFVDHPLIAGMRYDLVDVVSALNDETAYSRESIADWLCRIGGCQHEFLEPKIPKFIESFDRQRALGLRQSDAAVK